jgi:hypothetical protein
VGSLFASTHPLLVDVVAAVVVVIIDVYPGQTKL